MPTGGALGLQTWIWRNNFRSILLLCLYPLLLLAMVWAFFAAIALLQVEPIQGRYVQRVDPIMAGFKGLIEFAPIVFAGVTVWFGIAFFAHQSMINSATGAHPVSRREEPRIYNLLENLCISRGLTMPKLFVIETDALNAYASGLGEKSFSVTLTRGIMEALPDDELEAVMAHELTHIMNRDVRLLVISVIFVGMLSLLSEVAFRLLINGNRSRMQYHQDRDRGGGGVMLLIAAAIFAIGYVFSLFIRFALSRKREFLADAGAVQLTKNATAMIGALNKISGRSHVRAPDEVKQMFIENDHAFLGMFATHPPIPQRIAALKLMGGIEVEESPDIHRPDLPWGDVPQDKIVSPWERGNTRP